MDKESGFGEEIDLNKQQQKLDAVIEIINKEIINYIQERKDISEKILEYRKNNIEDYKDDEDKLIEYFDHENYIKEEAFNFIDKRLKELTILEQSPYYGMVKFFEEGFGEDQIYIGRFGITPKNAVEPLVVDWRAPVAAIFYGSSLGKISYTSPEGQMEVDVIKKRQYIIKRKKLLGAFDTNIDVKDEILQLVLSKNAEEKLKDIVMTIQAEQDNIIRQPRNKVVVVNGVAGSGKTTIALHRVAYLLYNFREALKDKVLILGPNTIFMEYISSVLPSLGEVGVEQKTYAAFAIELLDLRRREVMNAEDYMEKLFSDDKSFIDNIIYKNSDKFRLDLDEIINKTEDSYELQHIYFNEKLIMSKDECKKLLKEDFKDMPLFRRTKKIKRIIFLRLKDERDNKIRNIENEYKLSLENLTEEELKLNQTSFEFNRKLKIRETIKEIMELKHTLLWLQNPSIKDIYKHMKTYNLYTNEDLTALLYLSIKLEGLNCGREIKHVVLDEAQDYNKLAFYVINKLTNCLGMTVVGDKNQKLIPYIEEVSLEHINEKIETEYFNLNKSYRSTKEIIDFASSYLKEDKVVPLVRSGKPVEKVTVSKEQLEVKISEIIKEYKQDGLESIAIICNDLSLVKEISNIVKKNSYIKVIDKEHMLYKGGTVIIPIYLAKGLEFDGVIMLEADANDKVKYTMATRALHRLTVMNIG